MKMRSGKGQGMESEEGLRMGYGEPPYLWKRQRLMEKRDFSISLTW